MATGGQQISSLHLAIAAGGGVLLYAALRGVSPLQALKDVTSGAPPAVSTEGTVIEPSTVGTAAGSTAADLAFGLLPGGFGTTDWHGVYKKAKVPAALQRPAAFVAAASTHAGEKYSQSDRWGKGHSDCASFVGKALLDIGVEPPGGSTTPAYLSSGQWVKVSTPRAGDIAVNGKHMCIFLDGSSGIGQQNEHRNVQRAPVDQLMANTGNFEIRRYRGWA